MSSKRMYSKRRRISRKIRRSRKRRTSRKLRRSRKRRTSRPRAGPRRFGADDIKDKLQNLQSRFEKVLTDNLPVPELLNNLTSTGVITADRKIKVAKKIVNFAPTLSNYVIGKAINKMDIPDALNKFVKIQLDSIEPPINKDLKVEIHSIILNLLLYPETLYSHLPVEKRNLEGIMSIIKTIVNILTTNDLIDANLTQFLQTFIVAKTATTTSSVRYRNAIKTLLVLDKKLTDDTKITEEVNSIQTLINPILEHIKKDEYKDVLAPLIDTILYNNTHHRNTNGYLTEVYYA